MNLFNSLDAAALQSPAKTAIFWGELEVTYGHIQAQSLALSHHLVNHFKVQKGDRVGIWLRNCPAFVSALFGLLRAGATVVPINNFLKPNEVSHILTDAGIQLLITEEATGVAVGEMKQQNPTLQIFQVEDFVTLKRMDGATLPPVSEADLAVIIYTSGTTGRPKGAMLSHGNLLHNVKSCQKILEAVSSDRFVVLLPMFHSFMLTVGILLPLSVGGSLLLIKSLHPPKAILQEIVQRNATILPAIPQFFRTLASAQLPPNLPLRLCVSGAAPLPQEVLKDFQANCPMPLLEGYGLSEASPVCSMNPIKGPWKFGSIGIPILNVEMSVQSDEGTILGNDAVGEICVRGGNVMQGYWKNPEETAKAFRNGWLLTGDVGYRDSDGYYYITDRKKDMLLVNGINVYPREIEEVIYQFPGVKEAAVIGVPDARKGESPLAFLACKDNESVEEKALLQFLRTKLADYKVPKAVHILQGLPRNATGKILKTALREMIPTRGTAPLA